jgi:hypothetical protein
MSQSNSSKYCNLDNYNFVFLWGFEMVYLQLNGVIQIQIRNMQIASQSHFGT